jgi:hypothetical protein
VNSESLETLVSRSLFGEYGWRAEPGVLALLERLDVLNMINWNLALDDGEPLLHHWANHKKYDPDLLNSLLGRHPQLLDQKNAQGQSFWEVLWANRESVKKEDSDALKRMLTDTLVVAFSHAKAHHLGATDAAKKAIFQRVVSLQDEKLSEALNLYVKPVLDETEQRQLWFNLKPSQWNVARSMVSDLMQPIALTDTVSRPFWRWALDHGMARQVHAELTTSPTYPQHDVMRAWVDLYAHSQSGKKMTVANSKSELLRLATALPEGVGALDDLGRPVAWFLISKNILLLKDFAASRTNNDFLGLKDAAGHTLAYHLTPHLDKKALLKHDVSYLQARPIREGFTTPRNGQGLLVQWFADPDGLAYSQNAEVLPKWTVAAQTGNALHPKNTKVMEGLFRGDGFWAMSQAEGLAIARVWGTQPALVPQLLNFVLPLWRARHESLNASPLAEHLAALMPCWLLRQQAQRQALSTPTGAGPVEFRLSAEDQITWDQCMRSPWVITALDSKQIEEEIVLMSAPERHPTDTLLQLAHAFQSRLRSHRTLTEVAAPKAEPRSRHRP